MRYFRLLLGLSVIVVAVWVILGEQMAGASANAFVNARLTTVRAPVAGVLDLPERTLGAAVQAGEEIGSVSDPRVDAMQMNDLAMERTFATAELAALDSRLDLAERQAEPLSGRLAAYAAARVAELEARLDQARNRLSALEVDDQAETRVAELAAGAEIGEGRDPRLPNLALAYARERVAVLEIALNAARSGVFLGDGYNDAPYSEQRQTELASQRDGLLIDRDLAAARLAAIETRLAREQVRTSGLGSAALLAPAGGRVWEVLAGDNEVVERGQDVIRLVDCGSTVVSASVTENIYNRLRIGDPAMVRLAGDGQGLPGTILRLAGAGARTVYQNLAVTPGQRHLERYDVTLVVPALRNDPALSCMVGRTGRVFFERRPLDALRSLWQ